MFTIIIMMIVLFIGFLAKRAVLDIMEWVSPWGLDNSQEWDAPHMLPIIIIIITIIIILPQMKLPWNPKVPQSTKIAPEIHIFYDIAHIYSKGKKGTLFNLCKLHRSNQLNYLSRFWWRLWRPSMARGDESYKWEWGRHSLVIFLQTIVSKKWKWKLFMQSWQFSPWKGPVWAESTRKICF